MPARTIAIGDIHGCSHALQRLLEEIQPTPSDTIVTLGDYVDRGPDSRGVLEQLLELREGCQLIPLIGNHETMLLGALHYEIQKQFWLQCGGAETLASYGGSLAEIPPSHIDFLQGCRRFHETDSHIFVHANYDPDVPMPDQSDQVALWEHLTHITPPPHVSGKTVIVGHTPQSNGQILDLGHVIGIDTCVFGGGYLSALDVHTRQLWQADKHGHLRPESDDNPSS